MKNMSILIFLSLTIPTFAQSINGAVFDETLNEPCSFASVQLLDSSASVIKTDMITNEDGKFKFTNISPGVYCIKVSGFSYPDTIYRGIKVVGDTILNLDINRFCQFDASIKNNTCPVCHKRDKVIPIVYGLLVSSNGKDPMKDEGKTFKSGGCEISFCDPHWYCKRDKTEF